MTIKLSTIIGSSFIGSQGTQGLQGLQGTLSNFQGTQGLQGLQGVQGVQGVQGIAGPTNIPQKSQTSSYTLISSDTGKHISITTGGVTVPASVFSTGDAITIFNNSASNQTITQGGSVTLRNAGTDQTGNRTLAQYGLCTVLCVDSNAIPNVFVVAGPGLT